MIMLFCLLGSISASSDNQSVQLGTSNFFLSLPEGYQADEITVEYFFKDDESLDFDVYHWAKAPSETLEDIATEEAAEFDAAAEKLSVKGIDVFSYRTAESFEGKEYQSIAYMVENGDCIVELVFWLDGEAAEATAERILSTLSK